MYAAFVLTNLIFNYTFPCCLAGLRVGEGRKKSGKTSVVCHQKRQASLSGSPLSQTPRPWGTGVRAWWGFQVAWPWVTFLSQPQPGH